MRFVLFLFPAHSLLPTSPLLPSLCWCCLVTKLCLTPCDPMDCSPLGSSVPGISQARILEWVAIPFSRESSWPRDWHVSPALQVDSLPLSHLGSPSCSLCWIYSPAVLSQSTCGGEDHQQPLETSFQLHDSENKSPPPPPCLPWRDLGEGFRWSTRMACTGPLPTSVTEVWEAGCNWQSYWDHRIRIGEDEFPRNSPFLERKNRAYSGGNQPKGSNTYLPSSQ